MSERRSTSAAIAGRAMRAPRNWPLIFGLVMLAATLALAWFGPRLALHNPVKPVYIVQDPRTQEFVKPPFRPGQIPGYPLGADTLGRDTLSQLLWAIGPTLTLVLAAAAVRLALGFFIGVASGWSTGRAARLLQSLTAVAVAIPVLLAALCLVAAFGPSWGVWAFVLGLCLTGWAESARIFHDQTGLIKLQPYVEAGRALGASGLGLVIKHVFPHVLTLLWILLPFEISSALLTTAGLGFLGYFVNAIWIPLGDWTAVRAAGKPELGQMLASGAAAVPNYPWLLLTSAAAIFLLILTFNLLGEGLRRQMDVQRTRRRRSRLGAAMTQSSRRFSDAMVQWSGLRRGNLAPVLGAAMLLVLLAGSVFTLLRAARIPMLDSLVPVPGGHLWPAGGRHDAQGTYWANIDGLEAPQVIWQVDAVNGFAGPPVVAADGSLYLAGADSSLYAINPDGTERWIAALPDKVFGAPALNADGFIYLLDQEGKLYVLGPEADLIWSFQAEPGVKPLSGPVVDAQGVAYYATERRLIAVKPYGELAWRVNLPTYSYVSPQPTLSADGRLLFFEDILVDAATGRTLVDSTDTILDRYLVGADAAIYLASQETIDRVTLSGDEVRLTQQAKLDLLSLALSFRIPSAAGITPSGRIWVFYSSSFEFPKMLWADSEGAMLNVVDYPWSRDTGKLIGFGRDGAAYACGTNFRAADGRMLECSRYSVDRASASWKLDLEPNGEPLGGALVDGRLYVVSANTLYALKEAASR